MTPEGTHTALMTDLQIGAIDGAAELTTRGFEVVLDDSATVQLDDLIVTRQTLPSGEEVAHYGIVTEQTGRIEGAELPSDTRHIALAQTMPGQVSRSVQVSVLRTVPEKWVAPAPGGLVERAVGADRESALFLDQMAGGRLAIGFDQELQPIYGDFDFMNGVQGGHVSISGISGVAAKTSYALFLLYMMLESAHGRALLGPAAAQTRALVFNVKGEDLLHLDKPHRGLDDEHRAQWAALGIPDPGPFRSADFFVPPAPGGEETDQLVSGAQSRQDAAIYGWTPERFIREGLLRFCFTDADDRGTQVGFVEQVVRAELARHAYPLENEPGAVVDLRRPAFPLEDVRADRLAAARWRSPPVTVRLCATSMTSSMCSRPASTSTARTSGPGNTQQGTVMAFLRRLMALAPRLGHLIRVGVAAGRAEPRRHRRRHPRAARVRAAVRRRRAVSPRVRREAGHRPASRCGSWCSTSSTSTRPARARPDQRAARRHRRARPLARRAADRLPAVRRRDVEPAIMRNAGAQDRAAGSTPAKPPSTGSSPPSCVSARHAFLPGTMVCSQPLIPVPIPLRFPFPPFATNSGMPTSPRDQRAEAGDRARSALRWPACSTPPTGTSESRCAASAARPTTKPSCPRSSPGPRRRAGSDHPFRRRVRRTAARRPPTCVSRSARARRPRRDRPTVVLAGNHDSGALFEVFAMLLGPSSRVRFVSKARAPADGGSSRCRPATARRLRLAPVPFVHANRQVDWFGDPQRFMAVYATRMQLINDILREGSRTASTQPATCCSTPPTCTSAARTCRAPNGSCTSARPTPPSPPGCRSSPTARSVTSTSPSRYRAATRSTSARRCSWTTARRGRRSPRSSSSCSPAARPRCGGCRYAAGGPARAPRQLRADRGPRAAGRHTSCCASWSRARTRSSTSPTRSPSYFPDATLVEVDERIASRTLTALDPSEADDEAPEPTYLELLELYLQGTVTGDKTVPAAEVQALFATLHDSLYDEGDPPLEQLAEIMDAALPTPAGARLMRPLTLRITGLRSYRVERTVDFTGLSLVAIIGPTGAGKSSLLEAITYALYGASTWDRRAVKELISDAAASMRVSLEFRGRRRAMAGHTHDLPQDRREPRTGLPVESRVAKVDGDRAVNARIEELVGLDYDGFCACVLLPQGKFEQLLKATKKDRAGILKGILRLDELDLMRERADELTRRLTPRCEEIQEARAQFLPDPAGTRDQAAARQRELEPRRQALEQAKATIETLIEEVAEHTRIAREAAAGAERVDELLDPALLGRLRALDNLEGELAAERLNATETAKRAARPPPRPRRSSLLYARKAGTAPRSSPPPTALHSPGGSRRDHRRDLQLAESRSQLTAEIEAHSSRDSPARIARGDGR